MTNIYKHKFTIFSFIMGIWIGFISTSYFGLNLYLIFILQVLVGFLFLLVIVKPLWVKISVSLFAFILVFLLQPMPSISVGMELNNKTENERIIYLINFQKQDIKVFSMQPSGKKHIILCQGDDRQSLNERMFGLSATDASGKVVSNELFKIGDINGPRKYVNVEN